MTEEEFLKQMKEWDVSPDSYNINAPVMDGYCFKQCVWGEIIKSLQIFQICKRKTTKLKKQQTYGFDKGTTFRAYMQAFGARKWTS